MSFQPVNLTLWSNPQNPNNPLTLPQWWGYYSTTDSIATVSAAGYFNNDPGALLQSTTIRIGDLVYCVCSDGILELEVTALTPNITTVAFAVPAGSVNTAAIANGAVTAAKIANGTITTTQISPTAGILGTQLANNTVTTAQLDPTTIQYIKVPMTAAQWNAMYAAPFQLIPAPGANKAIIVRGLVAAMTFVTLQYAAGGAVIAQYDVTANGAGSNACGVGTIAAATVNGFVASSSAGLVGQVPVAGIANTTFVNKNVSLSNQTGAFTTGNSTWNIHVWFEVVTL